MNKFCFRFNSVEAAKVVAENCTKDGVEFDLDANYIWLNDQKHFDFVQHHYIQKMQPDTVSAICTT